MALTVKRITLWRREVENEPGILAGTLEPLANAGAIKSAAKASKRRRG